MKYEVGDKVRLRSGLICGHRYGCFTFTKNMNKFKGRRLTIREVTSDYYKILEDDDGYLFTDEMFDEVGKVTIAIYIDGEKVWATMDDKISEAKCSPEDEFDIFVGAKLALERLEEKCKPYAWLKEGVMYYFPDCNRDVLYDNCIYREDGFDKKLKNRGLVFKTKEEAIEAAKKMLAVLK